MAKEVHENETATLLAEREAERQELVRLLETAKDADRREFVRNAILALDTNAPATPSLSSSSSSPSLISSIPANGLNPAISSRLLGGSKVPLDTLPGSGRSRPTSATKRRPSFTPAFEVVPENRMLLHRSIDRSRETELSGADIDHFFSSCYDPLHPPSALISNCAHKGIPEMSGSWVSTGLSPQVLILQLSQRWLMRRISFKGVGVRSAHLTIDGTGRCSPSERLSDETFFVFDLTDVPSEDPGGVIGKNITINLFSNDDFIIVQDFSIKAVAV